MTPLSSRSRSLLSLAESWLPAQSVPSSKREDGERGQGERVVSLMPPRRLTFSKVSSHLRIVTGGRRARCMTCVPPVRAQRASRPTDWPVKFFFARNDRQRPAHHDDASYLITSHAALHPPRPSSLLRGTPPPPRPLRPRGTPLLSPRAQIPVCQPGKKAPVPIRSARRNNPAGHPLLFFPVPHTWC